MKKCLLVLLILCFTITSFAFATSQQDADLIAAIEAEDKASIENLLKAGANPNKLRANPNIVDEEIAAMHIATLFSDPSIMQLLVKYGGNVNLFSKDNITPLMLAVTEDNIAVTKYLLDNGANINHRIDDFTVFDLIRSQEMADLLQKYSQ